MLSHQPPNGPKIQSGVTQPDQWGSVERDPLGG